MADRGVTFDVDWTHYAAVQVDHVLRETTAQPGHRWGLFVKAGASDGNPNPYQGFVTGGIGGKGLFSRRPDDAFGIGYFHYSLSDALQSAIDPFFTLNDEQGLEAFYDVAVTPWLRVAGDVQYVNPALGDTDDAFLGGLRLKVRF